MSPPATPQSPSPPTPGMPITLRLPTKHYLQLAGYTFALCAATAIILRLMNRLWWCKLGDTRLWIGDIYSSHCSQHLLDPYAFTHISHGLLAAVALALIAPRLSISARFLITIVLECGWEILENSPIIINRYRTATIAFDYLGDSIINAMGDILACALGFIIAHKIGLWPTLILFIIIELALLLTIKDNLTLNVVMLVWPIEAIKNWQLPPT